MKKYKYVNYKVGSIIRGKKTGKFFKLTRQYNTWWWSFVSLESPGEMTISLKGLKRYELTDLNEETAKLIIAL